MTSTASSSASVSLLGTIQTSSPVSETNLTNMIDTVRACVSNDLTSDNDDDHVNEENDEENNDSENSDDVEDMDEAFIEENHQALGRENENEAEIDEEFQDLDQIIESFKTRVRL